MERGITTVAIMKMPVLFVGVSNKNIVHVCCGVNGCLTYRPRPVCHWASLVYTCPWPSICTGNNDTCIYAHGVFKIVVAI